DKETSNAYLAITDIEMLNAEGDGGFLINKELSLKITGINRGLKKPVNINLFFNSEDGTNIFTTCSTPQYFGPGEFEVRCDIPANFMNDNSYYLDLMVVENGHDIKLHVRDIMVIEGIEPPREAGWMGKFPGFIKPHFNWHINTINEHAV
ncbi:MAG: transporter, partial [Flavipsychrobacter sp.]|nr:transporter [Flavipsychrobacter sp.]